MATEEELEQYHNGSGHYEFPDGVKVRGKEEAEKYLDELAELEADVEAAKEEEAAAVAEAEAEAAADDDEEVTETDDVEETGDGEYLVEMTRQNVAYEYVGKNQRYRFTRDAPIRVVAEEDVEGLKAVGGFDLVGPEAAKEFYS